MFEVFVDEQDAVNSFFPGRAVRRYDVLDWVQEQEKTLILRSGVRKRRPRIKFLNRCGGFGINA